MLQDGCLTYPGANSVLRNWQPTTSFVYELSFSALTTCLVYQLNRLFLDIGLAQKNRGKIRISDLYILILISNLSVRSILSSFGCRGFFARRRFHGGGKACTRERAIKNKVGCAVIAKFVILLSAAPVIHIVGIFFSIERETVATFADVNFGGVALGLNKKGPLIDPSTGFYCPRSCTNYARGEVALTQFSRCYSNASFPFDNDLRSDTFILILRSSLLDIGVTLVSPGRRWISNLFLDIHTGESPYRLRNMLSDKQRTSIFEKGLARMTRSCEPEITRGVDISFVIPREYSGDPRQFTLSAEVRCNNFSAEEIEGVAGLMLQNVTIQTTEKLEVCTFPDDTFTSGENIDLLMRRTSTARFLPMLIVTLFVILARAVIGLVLNEEGHLAVEFIVKDALQMHCCDSLLQAENKVYYSNGVEVEGKFQGKSFEEQKQEPE